MDILDPSVAISPSAQSAVDIFKGEWSSKSPATADATTAPGSAPPSLKAHVSTGFRKPLRDFSGKRILELGPMEAGHAYLMYQAGAESILAVEANCDPI
ncbi:MAG: hypothetical protein E5Y74_06280 [Mesorhizobium sp.]|nr:MULTISPECIES: hypothetical protein [unclassified Mesorhizobium]AZV23030.1 hypothetical protein EJ079_30440 [Mesorhizobium sp. M7A.F.Ce.TU.012.03.2.1]RWD10852.1 MAG: hypothetical protein EOS73_06830 [Mesorhizobium sp.]RWP14062.1 MAG: hypothetical protein EOQ97_02135 [Mesorhizobium sp.]TIM23326.1 MAG: hypothetical protein E5Y74_06280 [Mesorhizobium sp.]